MVSDGKVLLSRENLANTGQSLALLMPDRTHAYYVRLRRGCRAGRIFKTPHWAFAKESPLGSHTVKSAGDEDRLFARNPRYVPVEGCSC